ncbi:hypothetical protein JCM8097_003640 [Rhodosporidiobolus ruineniae]
MSKTFRDLSNNVADTWWNDKSLRRNVLSAFVSYWGAFALGYDGSYLNGLQSLTTWNEYFDHPSGNRLGLISAMSYIPSLALMPLYSLSCDYLGRRPTNLIGVTILVAGALVGTFAKNEGMLIGGRSLVGIGGSLLTLSTNLLCNETLHPRLRSIGAAFFLVFYYTGAIVSAWTTFAVVNNGMDARGDEWAWRLPTLLQVVGPAIVFFGTLMIPESPRWLISKGKKDQAHKILADQHANGKMDDELVLYEMEEIENAIEMEKREKQGFTSFLKTRGNRHRLLILATCATGSQGNGVAVFSYYLTPVLKLVGVTEATKQLGINGGMQIWNLILAATGASLVEKAGRRNVWLIGTAGMLVSYICLTGLSGGFANTNDESIGLASVAFMFLCFGFYDMAWGGSFSLSWRSLARSDHFPHAQTPLAYSYTTEILPFSMRASGMAFFVWMQNATLCINQWVNPIALEKAGWKYYFIFLAALVVFLVIIWFSFVETKGLSLEEVALLFDHNEATSLEGKKEAVDAHFKAGGKATEIRHLEDTGDNKSSDKLSV